MATTGLSASNQFPDSGRGLTIIAFSHLRWEGVYQRPQHILSRLARAYRVIVWQECVIEETAHRARLDIRQCPRSGVDIATPVLPGWENLEQQQHMLLDELLEGEKGPLVRWYYTPMMLPFSAHLNAACTVYDCMDELSAFKNAPQEMALREAALFKAADLVFAGGPSIYSAKQSRHPDVHLFRSSVDVAHFMKARARPAQRRHDTPVLGYCGVIDERIDLDLLASLADARPGYRIEMAGPVAKIAPESLPQRDNLYWLGQIGYDDLPELMAGWDVALMPFALNDATRYISPTKTPEYLAAGLTVVTTPVRDVVRDYADLAAVRVTEASGFAQACDDAIVLARAPELWRDQVDRALQKTSWNNTVEAMERLVVRIVHGSPATTPRKATYDVLVVGAGFAGAVMAERLANDAGKRVLVVDRRPHIAGNAYDRLDDAGILIHQYGPHIFHTNSDDIVRYLSNFTDWRPYEHRVLAAVDGKMVPMPINRTTLNVIYDADLKTDAEAAAFLAARAEPVDEVRTSEDVVVSAVGRDLYAKFFQGYTRKQWGLDPSQLDRSVTARVPTRTDIDDRYFTDKFQAMPREGYTKMFERLLDNPLIDVQLETDFEEVRSLYSFDHIVFTGPIDAYFDYRFGRLPYRSLHFEHCTVDQEKFQPVAVVNYPQESTPYTRVTEYKYLTGQIAPKTSLTYEYPQEEGDPYYPIPRPENQALFKQYEALADREEGVTFVGRLATYRYYNMDQIVGQALAAYRRLRGQLIDTSPVIADLKPNYPVLRTVGTQSMTADVAVATRRSTDQAV